MFEYRDIEEPQALTATEVAEQDIALFDAGADAAVGTDLTADRGATVLEIRYRDERTFVSAAEVSGQRRWCFSGRVSPLDCRTHYLANL